MNFPRDFAAMAKERDELRAEVERLRDAKNFAWVSWHQQKGYELESITDHEEDLLELANGWRWLKVYAEIPT